MSVPERPPRRSPKSMLPRRSTLITSASRSARMRVVTGIGNALSQRGVLDRPEETPLGEVRIVEQRLRRAHRRIRNAPELRAADELSDRVALRPGVEGGEQAVGPGLPRLQVVESRVV